MRLTFEGETFDDLMAQVQLFIRQAGAVTGEMARHGVSEEYQSDSPDAFVPDFKDDFDPDLDQKKLDDPLPDEMLAPEKKTSRRKLGSKPKPTSPGVVPTLLDLAKVTDPDGTIAAVVEILNETNEVLDEMSKKPLEPDTAKPSRRKGNGKIQPTAIGQNLDEEITDTDLMKAASSAAQVLTPKEVQQIVADSGVQTVGELPQEERRDFINVLNTVLSKANDCSPT
jgi:hypothetical protein